LNKFKNDLQVKPFENGEGLEILGEEYLPTLDVLTLNEFKVLGHSIVDELVLVEEVQQLDKIVNSVNVVAS
jgi:hypothetical protein